MVGGSDDALRLHAFDDPCRAVVTNLKMALHKAGRSLAFAADHRHGLDIQLVCRLVLLAVPERIEESIVILSDLVDILRYPARF